MLLFLCIWWLFALYHICQKSDKVKLISLSGLCGIQFFSLHASNITDGDKNEVLCCSKTHKFLDDMVRCLDTHWLLTSMLSLDCWHPHSHKETSGRYCRTTSRIPMSSKMSPSNDYLHYLSSHRRKMVGFEYHPFIQSTVLMFNVISGW